MNAQKEIVLIGGSGREWTRFEAQIRACQVAIRSLSDLDSAKKALREQPTALVILAAEAVPDAVTAVRDLTFLYRGLPIVLATTGGSVSEAREAINAGAADYMLLPVEEPVVRTLLERYADQYFDPELGRGRRLITADPVMTRLLTQIRRVATSRATVLIQGESGTGKELIARFVHQVSDRADGPFVAINCAALPENLLESELFGHAKGAFTGAVADRKGKFQMANNGTILLDEISEMSLNLQAKLLRVLQESEVDPVGGRSPISLNVRVVASTNRDLKAWAAQKLFREDLFYRLNVFPVHLPSLRQRPKDILPLADHFRQRFVKELGRSDIPFSSDAKAAMVSYAWPGNIRELENIVHRALLVAEGNTITAFDLMIDAPPPEATAVMDALDGDSIHLPVGTTVRQMEEILIRRTLDEVAGNRTRAAELLGISIRTLRNKLNEYAGRVV
ncbi:MAG: sigma-54-dependent Fis family transcriptional regulator [Magnetococcales bacterium]|nr:sigma-54-dependent Fis family transcriptional regulator [Magnetococcales bacterium]